MAKVRSRHFEHVLETAKTLHHAKNDALTSPSARWVFLIKFVCPVEIRMPWWQKNSRKH